MAMSDRPAAPLDFQGADSSSVLEVLTSASRTHRGGQERGGGVALDGAQLRLTSETWREDQSGRTRTRAYWSGPAVPAIVPQTRSAVADVAAGGGVSGTRLADVRTCVTEAVTNAVMHAFRGSRTAGRIAVSAEFSGIALILVIKDDGVGFLPRNDSPGLGMGLALIASLSDSMSIITAPRGGTELSVTFDLAESPGDGA